MLLPPPILSREQREEIAACFREVKSCDASLDKMNSSTEDTTWQTYAILVLVGLVTGTIVGANIH